MEAVMSNGNGGLAVVKPLDCQYHRSQTDNLRDDVRRLQVGLDRVESRLEDAHEDRRILIRRIEQMEEIQASTLSLIREIRAAVVTRED
jgi:uncharacterized protein YaaN involved in tellurite resistance